MNSLIGIFGDNPIWSIGWSVLTILNSKYSSSMDKLILKKNLKHFFDIFYLFPFDFLGECLRQIYCWFSCWGGEGY